MRTILMILAAATTMACGEIHLITPDSGGETDAYYSEEDASVEPDAFVADEDAGTEDAGVDAFVALEDAGTDAFVPTEDDAGVDSGTDAGYDAGQDAGASDSGVVVADAGYDAGPPIYSTEHRCHGSSTRPELLTRCPGQTAWYFNDVFQCCATCIGDRPECLVGDLGEGWYAATGNGCQPSGWVNNADCR